MTYDMEQALPCHEMVHFQSAGHAQLLVLKVPWKARWTHLSPSAGGSLGTYGGALRGRSGGS